MKYIILLIIILVSFNIYGQFEPLNKYHLTYFNDESGNIACVKVDSITIEGNDSVIWNYNSFPQYSNGFICSPISWLGNKILKKNHGVYVFINDNYYSDSIYIHTEDSIGYSWTLLKRTVGPFLKINATIENKTIVNVLGQLDSIIVIRLQEKDINGNNVNNYNLNNKLVEVSKNHGFVSTFSWNSFPDYNNLYNIVSVDSSSSQYHMLKLFDVYNYDIGDELHVVHRLSPDGPGPILHSYSCAMMEILNKNYSSNYDTVTYLIHSINWSSTSAVAEDTVLSQFTNLNEYVSQYEMGQKVLPLVPLDEYSNTVYYSISYDTVCDRISESYLREYYSQNPGDSCYDRFEFSMGYPNRYYIEGVGMEYFVQENWDGCPQSWHESLNYVYVNKANCVYGIPLISPLSVNEIKVNSICIFPNPSTGIFNLDFGTVNITAVEILNQWGENIQNYKVTTKNLVVDLTDFPQGVYIVKTKGYETLIGKIIKY